MLKIRMSVPWGIILPVLFGACSCSTGQAIQDALGASAETPVFLGVKALSVREIQFEFSKSVAVQSLNFDPPLDILSIKDRTTGEQSSALVTLAEAMQGGERIIADLLVEDELGNTLGALIPFRARNDRIPKVQITELRTEYASPKVEFVEIKTLSAGNLG
ncbi:MAG: hypothetical protein LBG14_00920, partial [Treponema sp.]|nr:hypothetical protein [Treponema sp.]